MTEQKKAEPVRSPITGIMRYPVKSGNIESVGHDEMSGTIEVKFRNGAVWQYPGGYDRHTFEAFRDAESVGKFFNAEILRKLHAQKHVMISQDEAATMRQLGIEPEKGSV